MIKKHHFGIGISVSLVLFFIATLRYPGGSLFDKDSIGFDWTKNFISNLFLVKAINGSDNRSRYWAEAGVIFLSISYALFFLNFSKRIPSAVASNCIKYLGAGSMVCTFLITTPFHDLMVIIASTLFLINIFIITFYVLKINLNLLKIASVICLLIFSYFLSMYATENWTWLPIMQKVAFLSTILVTLCLEYFIRDKHFEHLKVKKKDY